MQRRIAFLLLTLSITLAVTAVEPQPAPATRTIVLVRHGHYVADAQDTKPGPGLSPLGIAQAKLVAARLHGMPDKFDALYGSPLTRAAETAAIIGAELGTKVVTLADLAECTPRTRRKEILAREKPEDMTACAAQLDRIFAAHFVPAQGAPRREMFVAHGNVIRYLVTRAIGADTESWLEMSPAHASMTTILVETDGRFKVIALGDSGHIPPALLTGSTGMSDKSLSVPR